MRTMVALVACAAFGVAAAQVVIVSSAGLDSETFHEARVPAGAFGVVVGGLRGAAAPWPDLLGAGGWHAAALHWDDAADVAPAHVVATDRDGADRAVVVHDVDGQRLAVLALTLAPPGHDVPGLEDPETALRAALVDVPDGVPAVVLVAGDRERAAQLLRSLPRLALALVSGAGGGDPEPLAIGNAWLVETPWGGGHWGVTRAHVAGDRFVDVTHRIERPPAPDEAVVAVKRRHGLAASPLDALMLAAPEAAPVPADTAARLASSLHVGGNRAADVRVHGLRVLERYGELHSPLGGPLLVLDVELENRMPLTLVRELEVPTEYQIRDLADHAYVVVNGTRLARLADGADDAPGHLPVRGFALERPGERQRGNLVFALPPDELESLALHVYDFAHGHVRFTLMGGVVAASDDASPTGGQLEANEVVEAGAFDVRIDDVHAGRTAPDGMTFVSVEMRARSTVTFEADATAFDPHAQAGDTTEVGTVADWLEAHRYLHLVADGERAYALVPDLSTLPPEPRFLPDVMTGGRVVFEVPADALSLTLRADFPNARMPDRSVIRPRPIVVPLRGEGPVPPERDALWSVVDDTLEVAITGLHAAPAFAGVDAGGEQRFLVLDVTVRNVGDGPEWFQTAEQLRFVDERGRQSGPHEATFLGPYRPTPHVWVPDGEQRSFQLVYVVDVAESRPRVAYRGFTLVDTVELPVIGE